MRGDVPLTESAPQLVLCRRQLLLNRRQIGVSIERTARNITIAQEFNPMEPMSTYPTDHSAYPRYQVGIPGIR